MYIVKIQANENGSRPAMQTWSSPTPPIGFALCDEEFYNVFYSTNPAGFVKIETDNFPRVTHMEVNEEALNAYVASISEQNEEELLPSEMEQLRADLDYLAALQGVTL